MDHEWTENAARGLAKSYRERLRGCNVRNMNPDRAEGLTAELQAALEPLLYALDRLQRGLPGITLLRQGFDPLVVLADLFTE